MSPRHLSILAATVVLLGGAVAIANPMLRLQPIAQAPTASPDPVPSGQATSEPMSPNRREQGWFEDLNLSADQVQKMRAIRNQYQGKISQGRQAVRQSRQELQALMAGDATEAQIREKYNQVKTLKQQVGDAQFESILATRKVLNPEQRRKFASRMLKRQSGDRPYRGDRGQL
ncbi:MAG: Spy/CpxP family protein refolding chaperone [Lyngbya sp. HA4199-MV5]|jgi:Spy/CpxP family protein refolding chaperone|nr:Spy/CpxP family protein refolding chaperone [Lyngbya sp. HA4199-MV5]